MGRAEEGRGKRDGAGVRTDGGRVMTLELFVMWMLVGLLAG
ncbi:MAG TPA: hypothetical protein VLH58_05290 [Candidatus Methylomirabilis sp.]|nr:hypothetical protein [Candidatus Methylomirabilis sp.]